MQMPMPQPQCASRSLMIVQARGLILGRAKTLVFLLSSSYKSASL